MLSSILAHCKNTKIAEVENPEPTTPLSPIRIKKSKGGINSPVLASLRLHNKTDSPPNQSPIFTIVDESPSPLLHRLKLKPVSINKRVEHLEVIKTSLIANSSISQKDEITSPLLAQEFTGAQKLYQKRQRLANPQPKSEVIQSPDKDPTYRKALARKPHSMKLLDDLSTSSKFKATSDYDDSPIERLSVHEKGERPKISSFTVKKTSVSSIDPKTHQIRASETPVHHLSASVHFSKENILEE